MAVQSSLQAPKAAEAAAVASTKKVTFANSVSTSEQGGIQQNSEKEAGERRISTNVFPTNGGISGQAPPRRHGHTIMQQNPTASAPSAIRTGIFASGMRGKNNATTSSMTPGLSAGARFSSATPTSQGGSKPPAVTPGNTKKVTFQDANMASGDPPTTGFSFARRPSSSSTPSTTQPVNQGLRAVTPGPSKNTVFAEQEEKQEEATPMVLDDTVLPMGGTQDVADVSMDLDLGQDGESNFDEVHEEFLRNILDSTDRYKEFSESIRDWNIHLATATSELLHLEVAQANLAEEMEQTLEEMEQLLGDSEE